MRETPAVEKQVESKEAEQGDEAAVLLQRRLRGSPSSNINGRLSATSDLLPLASAGLETPHKDDS